MERTIFLLNGPNLNLLGQREPEIYGRETLADLEARARARATTHGLRLEFRQTNSEGELVSWIHEARTDGAALILNAAGYTHTSVAVLDALKTLEIPVIELHLSNPHRREAFRHHSYVSLAATAVIAGLGPLGYELSVDAAAGLIAARA
ncbi:type II 3-dehydroquinate dehydratase [Limibaculum sp. M0105]|uniref:3-dehydroquinate dehydratase n=1 Tax=Thermohalobaculum xanthum TaxID=2753746 RepID=A0A8J7M4D3_9RHOB|nr:type II 3-dehydroquinate dehydratase [Thermohalobaculum xanthum]MBK0398029.1 type II 3-dehydroquinate dehydratase [Thermohalobaculum xanthum]